jgi:hypothetical protein
VATITRTGGAVDLDGLVPDLLRAHPEVRPVLDRHGLRGCGGASGPHETLRYFARAHGVDERRLLAELEAAIADPAAAGLPEPPAATDAIYRRFFLAGIAVVLTAGATWGAYLLWTIGLTGSFTAPSVHAINAHGEAQIFGWVGLFIMGFALQAFPRIWQTRLALPRLALATFTLMLSGIVVRTVGMIAGAPDGAASWIALAGGGLQVAAVCGFVAVVLTTFRRSGMKVEPYVGFVVAALAFFLASTVSSVWHTWHTMTAATSRTLVWRVATYQAPLRDLQVHGLAMFMVLGVSLKMLPGLFGVPRIADRRAWAALCVLLASVVAEAALFLGYRFTGDHRLAAGLVLPWLGLVVGAALIVLPWRPWRAFPERDRSTKFVRAAYGWLFVSLVMLLLMPAYLPAVGLKFSHAYFGATRHAITVGFISLMIMGFAAKVVPTLNGVPGAALGRLWGPFLLVNIGCALRVSLQTLTDIWPGAFPLVGISGTLEVIGLGWWGLGLAAIMLRGRREAVEAGRAAAVGPRPARIRGDHVVADVLAWFPDTERVLVSRGFTLLRQAALRRTLARQVTLAQAAALRGVALEGLLDDLNGATRRRAGSDLPVLGAVAMNPASCTAASRGAEPGR